MIPALEAIGPIRVKVYAKLFFPPTKWADWDLKPPITVLVGTQSFYEIGIKLRLEGARYFHT